MTRHFARLALGVLTCWPAVTAAHEAHVKTLRIVHPYTIAPSSGAPANLPILMTIENSGNEDDFLIGMKSSVARGAKVHGDSDTSGKIRVAAGSKTVLSLHSSHVELEGIQGKLVEYQSFPAVIQFERAGPVSVEILVEEPDEQPHASH